MTAHLKTSGIAEKSKTRLLATTLFLLLFPLLLLPHLACGGKNDKVQGKVTDIAGGAINQAISLEVTHEELEAALKGVPERRREQLKDKVRHDLIEIKLFANEAREAGLEKDQQIQEELKKVTDETLARFFATKYLDKQAEPSPEELEKYYREHQDTFLVPESVLIQHIVVQSRPGAEKVLKALKEGVSFEEMAKKKSICRCWKKGGNHGWFFKGRMDPALAKAAFALEKAAADKAVADKAVADKAEQGAGFSGIIKTEPGYQIIKVLDKKDKTELSFNEVKSRIRSRLFRERKDELIQAYYEKAGVSLHPSSERPSRGGSPSSESPSTERVLARIGGENITGETLAPILDKVPAEEKEKVRDKWVHYLVETRVFSREAEKVNLENDPEVAIELKRRTDQILANAFCTRFITGKIKIGDQDIENYYQSHLEGFRIPVKLRVKAIVVKTQQEAEGILKELKEGASFGELAVRRSIHPSASKAGEIGWFSEEKKDAALKDAALEEAAFALGKEETSGIIKTEAGYEIIKLMDKKGGQIRPLDEVSQTIKMKLMEQRVREEKEVYYQKAGLRVHASH